MTHRYVRLFVAVFLMFSVPFGFIYADPGTGRISFAADEMEHEIGNVVKDGPGNHKALYGDKTKDKYGNLVYGNSLDLASGTYTMDIELKTDNTDIKEVIADIGVESLKDSAEGYYKEIYARDIGTPNVYKTVSITFNATAGSVLTPFVYMVGTANLWVKSIVVKKESSALDYSLTTKDERTYEESAFFHNTGVASSDSSASNGKVLIARPLLDKYGFLAFGPYSTAEAPGNHQTVFRLKTDDIKNTKFIAKIEAFNSNGDGVNKFRKIRGIDFSGTNVFQDFPLDYTRTANGTMEFRTLFYNSGSVLLDNVRSRGAFMGTSPTVTTTASTPVVATIDPVPPAPVSINSTNTSVKINIPESDYERKIFIVSKDYSFGDVRSTFDPTPEVFTKKSYSLLTFSSKDKGELNLAVTDNVNTEHIVSIYVRYFDGTKYIYSAMKFDISKGNTSQNDTNTKGSYSFKIGK